MVTPARRTEISLCPAVAAGLFPFFIETESDGRIRQTGTSLARICPHIKPGLDFDATFTPVRPDDPFDVKKLRNSPETLYIIQDRSSQLILRGQAVPLDHGGFAFLGSPWISDPLNLAKYKLNVSDFAIHDPGIDLLHVLRSQQMATEDLRRLTDKLTAQRTQLKEANARLIAQEAETRRLALIAERTDNAVVLTNVQGKTEWINAGFTRLTGYTLEEIIGRSPGFLLQGPETDPAKVAFIREKIAAREGFRTQLINYGKNGRKYWVDFEVQPIQNAQGEVSHFMAIESDITDRRAAEANLRIQFNVSQILAEDTSLPEVALSLLESIASELNWSLANLWMYDPVAKRLNRTATWSPDEELGALFLSVVQQDTLSPDAGLPGLTWRTQELQWIEDIGLYPRCPRSSAAHACGLCSAVGFPIRLTARTTGVIELLSERQEARDESQLRTLAAVGSQIGQFVERSLARDEINQRSEELTRLNAELAAANRTKSEFLASISHEIRTPLNGVIGAAEALQTTSMDTGQREALEIVTASANHLHSVLNDVLDFSRIEANHLQLTLEPTRLQDFIQETARIFSGLARDKNITFDVESTLNAELIVSVDATRLRQILVNLLGNAFKFTAAGNVGLHLTHRMDGDRVHLRFEVDDSGIGIPPEQVTQLFKPFSQLDSSRTRQYGGTGLGLVISRQLANLMGGTLDIVPKTSAGSRFRLEIHAPTTEPATATVVPGPRVSSSAPLLVVDDNASNAKVLNMLLSRLNLQADHCFSAEEAFAYCATHNPPLILMDLHMPKIDGMEATRRLRAGKFGNANPNVTIIALTADVRSEVRAACMEAGMDDFLTKPVRLAELGVVLEKHLPAVVTTPPAPPVEAIDRTVADAIFDFQRHPELAPELRIMFHEMWQDIEPHLVAIETLRAAGDVSKGQAQCHSLRGAIANYGLKAAADVLTQMELDAETFQAPGSTARVRAQLSAGYAALMHLYPFLADTV